MKNHDKRNIALVHLAVIALYLGGLLFLVACAAPVGVRDTQVPAMEIYHNVELGATCFGVHNVGLSCLPDSVLKYKK